MPPTLGAATPGQGRATPGAGLLRCVLRRIVAGRLVGRLLGVLALEQVDVVVDLVGVETFGQRVVLARDEVLGQLVVGDAGLAVALAHDLGVPGRRRPQTSGSRFWARGRCSY